jgi:hypothetical protein
MGFLPGQQKSPKRGLYIFFMFSIGIKVTNQVIILIYLRQSNYLMWGQDISLLKHKDHDKLN